MRSLTHHRPESVEEACALLMSYNGVARPQAGGTDLLAVIEDGLHESYPRALVALDAIPGLDHIREEDDRLAIGARATLAEVAASPVVNAHYGTLARAAESGSPEIRARATVGGDLCQEVRCWYYRYPRDQGGPILCWRKGGKGCPAMTGDHRFHAVIGGQGCHAVCPSDLAVALTALEAGVVLTNLGGSRVVPLGDFYTRLGNVLAFGELVTEVRLPRPPEGARQTFLKCTVPEQADRAVASVAAVLDVEDGVCFRAALALGGVAAVPLRATAAERLLEGAVLDQALAERAAEAALAAARPLPLNAYKVALAKALVQRALLS